MSVLWEHTTVSRTVPTLLDHTIVAVILATVLTVMEEIVQVSPYMCMQCILHFCLQTLMNVSLTMEAAHKIAQTILGLLFVVAILDIHYSVMD